jgi:hypothetical protein
VNRSLVDIKDENSLLAYERLHQLAIRRNGTIMIDRDLWGRLDDANKTALVIHEVAYALVKAQDIGGVTVQDSVVAREFTGHLFTDALGRQGRDGLARVVRDQFNFELRASEYKRLLIYGNGMIAYNGKLNVHHPGLTDGFQNVWLESFNAYGELVLGHITPYVCGNSQVLRALTGRNRLQVEYQWDTVTVSLLQRGEQTFLTTTERQHKSMRPETYALQRGSGCEQGVESYIREQHDRLVDYHVNVEGL